jgi:WGR domain
LHFELQGEAGANALKGPFSESSKAVNEFKKKFSEKTGNKWENRDQFIATQGKYTLIEMGDAEDTEAESSNQVKLFLTVLLEVNSSELLHPYTVYCKKNCNVRENVPDRRTPFFQEGSRLKSIVKKAEFDFLMSLNYSFVTPKSK